MSRDEESVFEDDALDALLDVGRNERPPSSWGGRQDVYRHLAIGGIIVLAFARASVTLAGLPRVLRATATAVVVGAAIGSMLLFVRRSSPANECVPAPVAATTVAAPFEPPIDVTSEREAPAPTLSVDALPSFVATPAPTVQGREPGRAVARDTTPSAAPSLARETKSIAKIRSLVAAQDFAGALAAIAEHRSAFPGGLLGQEASVLEIEALRGADDPRGCRAGRAFLDAHPESAHRVRVMSLLRSCGE
ncbi:hypothetical protein AKJ09_07735 [Labilithrix luteola]|uniref:Outer membrane lipoprotein BamD-like domain-containing protein n=1 Tax=Labilithrix luteola TaxID=1391654 RepID=A0A0K1Q5X8_9BACT|nr:hypothetical protein [Labilithrix luteola]AKV01072.1 hypothetical protein AKJ09_07735 [Labilithrix luteola]